MVGRILYYKCIQIAGANITFILSRVNVYYKEFFLERENRQLIEVEEAHAYIIKTLSKVRVPELHARMVADNLVDADLKRVDTHGIIRFPKYVKRIQQGGVTAAA